jgi:DNA-binding protein HU-beta
MTKAELVETIAARGIGLTKKAAAEIADAVFATIGKAIRREGRFTYPRFGTWTVRSRKARRGRNPRTGEEMRIKPARTVGFKPAPELKAGL